MWINGIRLVLLTLGGMTTVLCTLLTNIFHRNLPN